MTHKIIDINNPPCLKDRDMNAVAKAFEEFANDSTSIHVPQREHLGTEFRLGVCCQHAWKPVAPTPENTEFLKKSFEESDLGTSQFYCSRCGATSLWDGGLWAYDSTSKFFGKVPPPRKERAPSQPRRK